MSKDLTPSTTNANAGAEAAVLGAMLLSPAFAQQASEELVATDFATPAHRTIFAAIQKLLGSRRAVDGVMVAEQLRDDGLLNEVGGAPFLHALVEGAPTSDLADHYLEIVRHLAILRGDRQEPASSLAMRDILVDALPEIERQHEEFRSVTGVPTGFAELDRLTAGLQPGHLIVIASRPSMGKTTLALDFARHASIRAGVPTLVCSLESSRTEIMQRMSCAECTIDQMRFRTARMEERDWTRLTQSLGKLADAPLYVDDAVAFSVSTIRAKAKQMHRQHGLGLLVVDPIQALLPFRPVENLYEQASFSVRGLKVIARELNIPVVAVSQLSRQLEARADKRPMLRDLRDSGALEDTADLIIFVYRDDVYDSESPRKGEADLIIAKQRNGPTDTVVVTFQGQYSRFAPMATRSL